MSRNGARAAKKGRRRRYHVVAAFESLEHSTLGFALGLVILKQHLWWFSAWWRSSSASAHAAGPQEGRFKETNAQLNLHTKLSICAAMVVVQSLTMLHVTIGGYGRHWMNGSIVIVGLSLSWVYFTYEAVLIFVDTHGFAARDSSLRCIAAETRDRPR